MHIAFFTGKFPTYSETFIVNQAIGLLDRGHEVTIFATDEPNKPSHKVVGQYDLRDRTVYVGRISTYWDALRQTPGAIAELGLAAGLSAVRNGKQAPQRLAARSVFKRYEDFDIAHAHFGQRGNLWSFVSEMPNQGPFVTTFYGGDVTKYVHPKKYHIYQNLWKDLDMAIGISQHVRARMIMLGCPESLSTVLPIGIDPNLFDFSPTEYDGGPLSLVSICRHTPKKGLKYAIRAVKKVVDDGHEIQYTIAGDGQETDLYRQLVQELELTDCVEFVGRVTQIEVSKLMKDAHLYVQPSMTTAEGDMEGQGLVFQEAQATGTPPIATFHDGIPEGVRHGKTGRLVPERDVGQLADALRYFFKHPKRIGRYANAGRAYVKDKFDYRTLARQQERIYEQVIEEQ